MHFWINKPAGRYYGFSGRRYPATPLPKTRSDSLTLDQRRRGRDVRPMVTPVHRFQSLNGASSVAGPSSLNTSRPLRPAIRNSNETRNNSANIALQLIQPNSSANSYVSSSSNSHHAEPNAALNATNRGLLDFSEFSDAELAGYRVRCGVWITFVLVTGFMAAAKFYYDHQGTGLEVLLFCGLLITLLLSGCFYSILYRRAQNNPRQEVQVQDDPIAVLTAANTIANENIRPIPVVRQNPPPPYHIAILIPPSNSPDEVPPPSYDKVVH